MRTTTVVALYGAPVTPRNAVQTALPAAGNLRRAAATRTASAATAAPPPSPPHGADNGPSDTRIAIALNQQQTVVYLLGSGQDIDLRKVAGQAMDDVRRAVAIVAELDSDVVVLIYREPETNVRIPLNLP